MCLIFVGLLGANAWARTWTDASGTRKVEANYLGFENGQVKLQFARTGEVCLLPLGTLSEDDQAFVNQQIASAESERERADGPPDPLALAIRKEPANPLHYVVRGRARTMQQDYDGAIRDFTKAIELAPDDATTYNARGVAYQAKHELIAAGRDFDQAIELNSRYASAYRNRGENLRKLALAKEQSVPELDAAIDKWQQLWNHARKGNLKRTPWQPVHVTKGDVSRQAALRQMAKIDLDFAKRLERDYDDRGGGHTGHGSRADHGHAHPGTGCPYCGCPTCGGGTTAAASGVDSPNGIAGDAASMAGLAEKCVEERSYDRAVAAYDRLIEDDPANLVYLRDRAATHLLRGGYDRAVRDYDYLLSLRDSPDAALYYNRGCAHLAADRLRDAISDFTKSITLNETWSLAYNNRGATYARMGLYGKAIEDFTEAIKSDSDNRLAYRNRALAYQKLGQPHKAEADFAVFLKLKKEGSD